MPKSAVFMKKSERTKLENSPGVGSYDPIRYNDIGAKEALKLANSNSKKQLGRKMSLASIRKDISPEHKQMA